MKNIHLIMPFSRPENKEKLIEAYRPMGVILHPIMFADEAVEFPEEDWIRPVLLAYFTESYLCSLKMVKVSPMNASECKALMPGTWKRNWFIKNYELAPDDYYLTADDDDMYEPGVMDAIKQMDDDIVIISMKRGKAIPSSDPVRRYGTNTLYAKPENMKCGSVSAQQMFVKGKLFKAHLHNEESHCWDGELAEHYFTTFEKIAYRPDLFALFNYYEPGRWEGEKYAFGALVNDAYRLNTVLKKSALPGPLHIMVNPESATKGLNKLLNLMEGEGVDVAVLAHQDMYFRNGWFEQMKSQLALLPDSWVCAGIVGKDMEGRISGKLHDMRIVDIINSSEYNTFPEPAACFDECVIIINLKTGFRFDEGLDGFDLYGTMCVHQAWEMGGTAWIIDAFAEHYCMRGFDWWPPDEFKQRYKWLYDKYQERFGQPDSTVFVSKPHFETSAA